MIKPIKCPSVPHIPSDNVPYKNRWGKWVWKKKGEPDDPNWPGLKAPDWVKNVVYVDGKWCWTD